jgi:hypothetical protein
MIMPWAGPIAAGSSTNSTVVPTSAVRLYRNNFMLWRGLTIPHFAGANFHGHLDGTMPAPEKTLIKGTGDDLKIISNPDYARWRGQDQKVLGLILGSMEEDIAT